MKETGEEEGRKGTTECLELVAALSGQTLEGVTNWFEAQQISGSYATASNRISSWLEKIQLKAGEAGLIFTDGENKNGAYAAGMKEEALGIARKVEGLNAHIALSFICLELAPRALSEIDTLNTNPNAESHAIIEILKSLLPDFLKTGEYGIPNSSKLYKKIDGSILDTSPLVHQKIGLIPKLLNLC